MSKSTAVTVTQHDTTIAFRGAGDFTSAEIEQVRLKLNGDLRLHLDVMNREYLQLDAARADLAQAIRRAERNVRETKEYQQLQALKGDMKMLNARHDELRTKAHGIFEAVLGGVRRGTALYKKLAMLLSADLDGGAS